MQEVLNAINSVMEKVAEWLKATLDRLSKFLERKREAERRAEIEQLVTKLWRIQGVYKLNVSDLKYVEQYNNEGKKYFWIIDYDHKYIFGKDD